MKKLNLFKRLFAISLAVLLMVTSNIIAVSAIETELSTQKKEQSQKQDILSTSNQYVQEVYIFDGEIEFIEENGTLYYKQGSFMYPYDNFIKIIGYSMETQNKIIVKSGTHNIILDSININVYGERDAIAFDVHSGATAKVTLAKNSVNYLSSDINKAGLQVQEGGILEIKSEPVTVGEEEGTITVKGGDYGAAIGSSYNSNFGSITINSGNITATAGQFAAAIGGGGSNGNGGNITINGGNIRATGGQFADGIGSGYFGNSCNITINGGNVTATGGQNGAGIGGGDGSNGGNITISGGNVIAQGGQFASGIGAGYNASGAVIHIDSDAKVTAVAQNTGTAINDIDNVIEATQGKTVGSILDLNFQTIVPIGTTISLLQDNDYVYSYTNEIENMTKLSFASLKANTDYQVEMQYPDETTKVIKYGIIDGETLEKDSFNTSNIQTTKVTIIDYLTTFFMITDEMSNSGWSVNNLKAVTSSNKILSINSGLTVQTIPAKDLIAFGKSYEFDYTLIKATSHETGITIKFYIEGQENNEKLSTPTMNIDETNRKVIYIGDLNSYNSQTVDKSTLIKELTYDVTIDYPDKNNTDNQNLVTDQVYLATEVRQFAISDSRYHTYIFGALDDERILVENDILLPVVDILDKTYELSIPVEEIELTNPYLSTPATVEAKNDIKIKAISTNAGSTIYDDYDNAISQYYANITYGKTAWIYAPEISAEQNFVGWYSLDKEVFVSYENEYKFIMTQKIAIIPIYSDNTFITVSDTPYAFSENALYETYVTNEVAKIQMTMPITYFPQGIEGASYKLRYQVAQNGEAYDLNANWTEVDLSQNVNAQNRVNYYLTTDLYKPDGSINDIIVYAQPYLEYEVAGEMYDTKEELDAISILQY